MFQVFVVPADIYARANGIGRATRSKLKLVCRECPLGRESVRHHRMTISSAHRDQIQQLRQTIRDLHGRDSIHTGSEPVSEWFQGRPVWDGTVEIFKLIDHPQAKFAYAWSRETDSGGKDCVAVLGIDPIKNPADAVHAVAAQARKQSANDLPR